MGFFSFVGLSLVSSKIGLCVVDFGLRFGFRVWGKLFRNWNQGNIILIVSDKGAKRDPRHWSYHPLTLVLFLL